jgi:uncharacterized protein
MTHPGHARPDMRGPPRPLRTRSNLSNVLCSSEMHVIQHPAEAARYAAAIVRRHLPDPSYCVFLFGSRATGTAHPRSDIDIGIEGPAAVPGAVLAAIEDEIDDAPTLYTIEIVDFARVSEAFRRVARERIPL